MRRLLTLITLLARPVRNRCSPSSASRAVAKNCCAGPLQYQYLNGYRHLKLARQETIQVDVRTADRWTCPGLVPDHGLSGLVTVLCWSLISLCHSCFEALYHALRL